MQLAATPAEPETPSTEGRIPKALEDSIDANCTWDDTVRSALREPDARVSSRYDGHGPPVAMESVSSRSSSHSKRDQDEDPDDLFDLDAGLTETAAAVSTATAGAGVARVCLSAFSELKEFNGKDASEEKARAWFNRLKSASRRNEMSGDEVCALFGDLMAGPARQWYLQLKKSTRTSWTELTDQFRICDQDRDDEERAKMFMTGHAPQQENVRRDFETGGAVHDRPKCRHCGSRRHSEGDCWSLLTCQKCAGQHPTDRCLRACKACGDVHEAGKCSLEDFFNRLRQ
ncbi:Eukaryotic/viral aspartic protease [Phytophthora megakarya]|uniref:Eukaryotic/viral aspartic protease n=1 Tax=Phytophthora megakarya TaxID=4795 RepID=A0A225UIA3_9STRA|nr:Eukaryotic/viral aspartic protease [Phytophthora megakarya]